MAWCRAEELFDAARGRLLKPEVALDVGCGIRPQQLVTPQVHVCCEPFPEYAKHLVEGMQSTRVVLQASWAEALDLFPDKSVDTVFLLDVIEHLDKEEGRRLLSDTERITRGQIVVFTPLGFLPQPRTGGPDAWGMGGDEVQEHKSGWTPDDFDQAWEILAAKEFHKRDAYDRPLAQPFGAFFAIKTLESSSKGTMGHRAELLEGIGADARAMSDSQMLEATAGLLRDASRLQRAWMLLPSRAILSAALRVKGSVIAAKIYRAVMGLRPWLSRRWRRK